MNHSDISFKCPVCEAGLTRLQVAELGQRPHLQMIQVEGVGLPAGQIPHDVLIDHTHTAELHQGTEQQGDLTEARARRSH